MGVRSNEQNIQRKKKKSIRDEGELDYLNKDEKRGLGKGRV